MGLGKQYANRCNKTMMGTKMHVNGGGLSYTVQLGNLRGVMHFAVVRFWVLYFENCIDLFGELRYSQNIDYNLSIGKTIGLCHVLTDRSR